MTLTDSQSDPGARAYPPSLYAWSVVGLLFCTAVLSYTDRQVLSLLVDPVRRDLQLGDTSMSLLLGTAFAVIYGVAGVPLGFWADRTSRRNLIFGGVLIWSIGTVLCAFTHQFSTLFGARLLVGLGEAALSPAAISLISDYFAPSRRGFAVGVYFTGIAIGVGGSILIGGSILNAVDGGLFSTTALAAWPSWRLVFLCIGAPSLLWCLLILLIREPPRQEVTSLRSPALRVRFSAMDKSALLQIAPIYLAVAVASLVDNAVGAWAPSLLIRKFGVNPAHVGVQLGLLLMAGYGGGMLTGGLIADLAHRRRRARGKAQACLIAALLVLPISVLMALPDRHMVMIGVPLYFFVSALVTACGLSAILDYAPNQARGAAMSVSFFLNVAIGAGLGPLAVSLVAGHIFPPGAGLGPAIAFTAATAYALAAAAVFLCVNMKSVR